MTQRLSSSALKPQVLISGALPPPMGGVGAYYQTLLNSSLPNRVKMQFVQTSSQKRELSGTGKATLSNLFLAIQDCIRFTKAVIIFRPKLTHISTAIGLSFVKHTYCVGIARLFGSRVLLHPHCSLTVLYYQRPKWWQWYFRQVIRLTNGVIALSREWLQLNSIIPNRKVFYLPNAINIRLYENVAAKHLSEKPSVSSCRVLYMGTLDKTKGTYDILEAAGMIGSWGLNAVFNLVGGALSVQDEQRMQEYILTNNMNDTVYLQSIALGKEKIDYLTNANIYVYPSYNEGMPIAVLEAMACGLPIVATKVGGLPDLIQDGINGFLVDPGKPEQLASAIARLAKDSDLRASMGKASYQYVCEQYDIETHVTHLVEIYKQVLSDL
jgi:glycosyltransferase involved in cell wall biosynthesis